jgi:hypothetical protein
MYGHTSRVLFAVFANAHHGKDEEYNYWCDHVHIPDAIKGAVFERAHRYKALRPLTVTYLNLWESDSEQLALGGFASLKTGATNLREGGRIWPVFDVVWSELLVAVGPGEGSAAGDVSVISTVQNNWRSPALDQAFEDWGEPPALNADSLSPAVRYRYQSQGADSQARRLMALHEDSGDPESVVSAWQGIAQPGPSPFGKYTTVFDLDEGKAANLPELDRGSASEGRDSRWVTHWLPLTPTERLASKVFLK